MNKNENLDVLPNMFLDKTHNAFRDINKDNIKITYDDGINIYINEYTLYHTVNSGFEIENEFEMINEINLKFTNNNVKRVLPLLMIVRNYLYNNDLKASLIKRNDFANDLINNKFKTNKIKEEWLNDHKFRFSKLAEDFDFEIPKIKLITKNDIYDVLDIEQKYNKMILIK
jgi:hypothetical protein